MDTNFKVLFKQKYRESKEALLERDKKAALVMAQDEADKLLHAFCSEAKKIHTDDFDINHFYKLGTSYRKDGERIRGVLIIGTGSGLVSLSYTDIKGNRYLPAVKIVCPYCREDIWKPIFYPTLSLEVIGQHLSCDEQSDPHQPEANCPELLKASKATAPSPATTTETLVLNFAKSISALLVEADRLEQAEKT